jgi:hypothetical protein
MSRVNLTLRIPIHRSGIGDEVENAPIISRPILCFHLRDLQHRGFMELQVQCFNEFTICSGSALGRPAEVVVLCGCVSV